MPAANEQTFFDWVAPEPPLHPLPRVGPLSEKVHELASHQIYLGTSSWKYEGWLGQIYDRGRYSRGKRFLPRKFADECLSEYAAVFPTVCGDFAFYQFPTPEFWERIFAQVPTGFRFGLKVPDEITVERFPKHARYGPRAGTTNENFLNAGMLSEKFLGPLELHRDKLGTLIFEFGTIHHSPLARTAEFAARLDGFLGRIPTEQYEFAVEVRNKAFLEQGGEYLSCFRNHRVAHCLNNWTRMPPIAEQMQIPGILTAPHVAARFLLRDGRAYEDAVETFSPYERVQDPNPEGRAALADLIRRCQAEKRTMYAFVNNRFEGNAIETIEEALKLTA